MTEPIEGAELVESPTLRSRHLDRTDVLDKVGELAMLPGTALATTKQVAEFYEVSVKTLESVIEDNRLELEMHGFRRATRDEIRIFNETPREGGSKVNRLNVFSRTAALNVGMLLTSSSVAQRTRAYLLAVEELAPLEQRQSAADLAATRARTHLELIQAAKGLVDPRHLEAKARIVLARGLGEAPELEPAHTPLYAQTFLEEKGLNRSKVASISPVFGKRVKAAYVLEHGASPERYPLTTQGGQVRLVNAYTESDRPLLERVWQEYYATGVGA